MWNLWLDLWWGLLTILNTFTQPRKSAATATQYLLQYFLHAVRYYSLYMYVLWSTSVVQKLEEQKKWSQLPHSKGKYPLLSGRRRSRHRSQIVVNDTLGDSGDSVLSKYVSILQRVAFLIFLLCIWTTSSRHFPNNKIFNHYRQGLSWTSDNWNINLPSFERPQWSRFSISGL